MLQSIVEIKLMVAGVYLGIGAAFALVFQVFGLAKVDPAAKGAGLPFRLLITPGLVALWPVIAMKWKKASNGKHAQGEAERPVSPDNLRRTHGLAAKFAALFLPIVFTLGFYGRSEIHSVAGPIREEVGIDEKRFDREVMRLGQVFRDEPIEGSIRTNGEENYQLELKIGQGFDSLTLALFWSGSEDPKEGSLLGLIWGPGERRFALPTKLESGPMRLLLYSMTDHVVVATSAPIDTEWQTPSEERG